MAFSWHIAQAVVATLNTASGRSAVANRKASTTTISASRLVASRPSSPLFKDVACPVHNVPVEGVVGTADLDGTQPHVVVMDVQDMCSLERSGSGIA